MDKVKAGLQANKLAQPQANPDQQQAEQPEAGGDTKALETLKTELEQLHSLVEKDPALFTDEERAVFEQLLDKNSKLNDELLAALPEDVRDEIIQGAEALRFEAQERAERVAYVEQRKLAQEEKRKAYAKGLTDDTKTVLEKIRAKHNKAKPQGKSADSALAQQAVGQPDVATPQGGLDPAVQKLIEKERSRAQKLEAELNKAKAAFEEARIARDKLRETNRKAKFHAEYGSELANPKMADLVYPQWNSYVESRRRAKPDFMGTPEEFKGWMRTRYPEMLKKPAYQPPRVALPPASTGAAGNPSNGTKAVPDFTGFGPDGRSEGILAYAKRVGKI